MELQSGKNTTWKALAEAVGGSHCWSLGHEKDITLLEMGSSGNSIKRVPVTGQIELPWIVIATPIGGCYPSGSNSN